ncbi:MAG TPA: recombinase family protein, partial [Methylomirabilota bacterium]|nr:recombinase family protein [Methylomirabilota bacterium]
MPYQDGRRKRCIIQQSLFNIFASFAEFERALIRERTRAGLQAARARGRF